MTSLKSTLKNILRRTFLICALSFCTSYLAAADLTQDQLEEFEISVAQQLAKHHLPGVAVAIVSKDDILYQRAFGDANLETGEVIHEDTVFQLASISKTFIALLIADYVNAGIIEYDDPVRQYIKTDLAPDVRISDLLSHRSGYKGACAPIEKGLDYKTLKRIAFKKRMPNCIHIAKQFYIYDIF